VIRAGALAVGQRVVANNRRVLIAGVAVAGDRVTVWGADGSRLMFRATVLVTVLP